VKTPGWAMRTQMLNYATSFARLWDIPDLFSLMAK
jgi:hypothetical protein